jgi:hypothetical protein
MSIHWGSLIVGAVIGGVVVYFFVPPKTQGAAR